MISRTPFFLLQPHFFKEEVLLRLLSQLYWLIPVLCVIFVSTNFFKGSSGWGHAFDIYPMFISLAVSIGITWVGLGKPLKEPITFLLNTVLYLIFCFGCYWVLLSLEHVALWLVVWGVIFICLVWGVQFLATQQPYVLMQDALAFMHPGLLFRIPPKNKDVFFFSLVFVALNYYKDRSSKEWLWLNSLPADELFNLYRLFSHQIEARPLFFLFTQHHDLILRTFAEHVEQAIPNDRPDAYSLRLDKLMECYDSAKTLDSTSFSDTGWLSHVA